MKHTFTLLVFAILLTACGGKKKKPTSINRDDLNSTWNFEASTIIKPVIKTIPEEFLLRGTHARLIRTKLGTRIHVPASAFVNKVTGDIVKGDVTLTYNEYQTQGQILASGIPMTYITTEGDTVDFESAGVFDVRAFQDGIELELAEDKVIEIEMATEIDGAFDFYTFVEEIENWELKDSASLTIVNPYIAKQKMELEKLDREMPATPKELIEYEVGDHLFDVKRYGGQEQELESLDGVFWKFTGDSTQVDPSEDNKTFNKTYNFVDLVTIDSSTVREYDMIFDDGSERIVVRAAPIFQGKLLTREKDRMNRILSQIKFANQSKEQIEQELAEEKSLMRIVRIDRMGIYNFNRQYKGENLLGLSAQFTVDGQLLDDSVLVFLLPVERRCVVRYTPSTFKDFKINPNETNRLLAINRVDKTLYVLSSQEIRTLSLGRKKPGESVLFDLKKHGEIIENSSDLDELILSL